MANASSIYAERLSNIGQISVIVALSTPHDSSTKVELYADRQQFILQHKGETTILRLPGQLISSFHLQSPAVGRDGLELSWRIPMAGRGTWASMEQMDSRDNEAPWPASSLAKQKGFNCRACGVEVVKGESIETWKDLPSENWAEMMDFWHCHKPDVPHTNGSSDQNITSKGYSANSKFMASPGTGFVDTMTVLLSDSNCPGIQTSQLTGDPSLPQYQAVTCKSCSGYLGYIDRQSEGIRLFKWRLSSPVFLPQEPSIAYVLAAQLLSITLSQCVSRIVIHPHPDLGIQSSSQDALSCWVFGPSIRYSSSGFLEQSHHENGKLAMKVFWQSLSSSDEVATMIGKENVEDLLLPSQAISELRQSLEHSASILPPSARKFQQWNVGLLERYDT